MSNELTNMQSNLPSVFNVVCNEDLLSDMQGINLKPERIKMPLGGTTTFEVMDDFGESETVSGIRCVILYQKKYNAFYASAFDGSNAPPDCCSYDGITALNGDLCAECPNNVFDKDEKGRFIAKKCKSKSVLYILREGRLLPSYIVLSVMSTEEFDDYVNKLVNSNKHFSKLVTNIYAVKDKSKGGIVYSLVKFRPEKEIVLSTDDLEQIGKKKPFCIAHANRNSRTLILDANTDNDSSGEAPINIDPETGEIIERFE